MIISKQMNATSGSQLIFEAADLITSSVIIYSDRAEVKRLVRCDLQKGNHEIIVQNVSAVIERQSVRVDGRGVLIQEVQYQEMSHDMSKEAGKIIEIENQKSETENDRFAVEDECCSIRKRIEVLDGVAAQIASGPPGFTSAYEPPTGQPNLARRHTIIGEDPNGLINPYHSASSSTNGSNPVSFLYNQDSLDNLSKFLQYYGNAVSEMKRELRRKQRESESLTEKIDQLDRQLDQLRCGAEYDSIKRNISIVVEMEESGSVELYITYQVYCASWKPAYDIRATTAEDDGDNDNSVQLCYYGMVEQNTGDDWKDCDIVLSTCSASLGGSPPHLATLSASLHSSRSSKRHATSAAAAAAAAARRKPMSAASDEDMGFGSFDYNEIVDAAALHRLTSGIHSRSSEENSVSTQGLEHVVSTCFSIPRSVTILSNGAEHKLLISKMKLSCAFSHDTVPSRSTSAFLSALITNTSQMPLLPGPAAVYVNNCFVTKTHLRLVTPGDEFRCNMGVDPSVKVEYKAPNVVQEQVGFMSKNTLMTHEQLISVRNAKVNRSVRIIVKEQIPKSNDDKIKVAVVSPEIRHVNSSKQQQVPDARLNKDHNLEWSVVLAPGQHRLLSVKYTIEHPASESLTYKVV